ncbi:hypothetical protein [Oleiharenicola lentus]|uniref:hypothetical protein n=1 Tax=Oleiharenicola lentus TaxID=2508720 RepID=UPI003F672302
MKRGIMIGALIAITALLGVFTGRWQGQREVLVERTLHAKQAEAQQQKIRARITDAILTCDEILVEFSDPLFYRGKSFKDENTRREIAAFLRDARLESESPGFWATRWTIRGWKQGQDSVSLSWLGSVLRVSGDAISGEFIVGSEVTSLLQRWVEAKVPAPKIVSDSDQP